MKKGVFFSVVMSACLFMAAGFMGCGDYMDEGFTGRYGCTWDDESGYSDSFDLDLFQHEDGTIVGWYSYNGLTYEVDPPRAEGMWQDNLTTFTIEGGYCWDPGECFSCSSLFHGHGTDTDEDGYYDTVEGSFQGTCPLETYRTGT